MPGKGCYVPAIQLERETWFLLCQYGDRHVLRYISRGDEKRKPDPSGHRLNEVVLKGSVKWRPYDTSQIDLTTIPALGPTRQ